LTVEISASPTDSFLHSVTPPPKQVAIFAATLWEVQAVQAAFGEGVSRHIDGLSVLMYTGGSREYWLVQTGVGPEKAARAAARLFAQHTFALAVSTGFACALMTTEVGALLVGRDVVALAGQGSDASPAVEVPGSERDVMLKLAEGTAQPGHIGRFVSTDRIIPSAAEKRRFASATEAVGLDMESAALATEAQRAGVPFVIVRTVSDLLDEDLPLDFNLFLRPTGWLKGLAALIGNPSSVAGLCRLRRQSRAAAHNLTMFFRRYAQG
jgi:adenosylhomocysteine nucleosidase